jgi:polyhydroxyalkanoate synthesis regulator phasin
MPEYGEVVRVTSHLAQMVAEMREAGKVSPETATRFFDDLRRIIRESGCTDAMWKYRQIIAQL